LIALGALIGSRFNGIQPSMLKSAFFAGLFLTCLSIVVAALGSLCAVALLDLDLAILLISFAPGGVEAMAAIAAEMGLNPAFVAGHHVWRLMILTLLLPALGLVKPQR
jgi:membrane AbrB-like protein